MERLLRALLLLALSCLTHHDKSFEFIAMIPTFQLGKLMPRKVEFLAQDDAVPGARLRTQVYVNLEPYSPGLRGAAPQRGQAQPTPRSQTGRLAQAAQALLIPQTPVWAAAPALATASSASRCRHRRPLRPAPPCRGPSLHSRGWLRQVDHGVKKPVRIALACPIHGRRPSCLLEPHSPFCASPNPPSCL